MYQLAHCIHVFIIASTFKFLICFEKLGVKYRYKCILKLPDFFSAFFMFQLHVLYSQALAFSDSLVG